MRKGQITLYVIIAILIVSSIGFIVYTQREALSKKAESVPESIKPIDFFISSCVEKTAEDAMFFIGQQGGYYVPASNSAGSVAYYFYNNQSYVPKEETIEQQLAFYMNDNLGSCIANFSNFTNYDISYGEINSTAKILNDRIRFNVYWPVVITQASKFELSSFSADIPSRLSLIYDISSQIVSEQLKSQQICLSCMVDLGYQNGFSMTMESFGANVIIFRIQDKKILLNNQPYEFAFANKY